MKTTERKWRRSGRQCVMAMVLGTALASLPPTSAQARTAEAPGQAIQDISRYCSACWRNARVPVDRWADCTQEVFRRLLERVPPEEWDQVMDQDSQERREFLRAIDAVKKQTRRERYAVGYQSEAADGKDALDRSRYETREILHRAADTLLSQRQRQILQLTCEGWSIPEIGDRLAASSERISDEKYKAIRKLREHFAGQVD